MTEKMEPVAYVMESTLSKLKAMSSGAHHFQVANTPFMCFAIPLYTADQVKGLTDRARDEALEEAARLIDETPSRTLYPFFDDLAYRIRELSSDKGDE